MNIFCRRLHRLQLLCLLTFGISGYMQGQTAVHVMSLDNSVKTYNVKAEGKVWFDLGNMLIQEEKSTNVQSIDISSIRKVTLEEDATNGKNKITSDSKIEIFPNPAKTYFDLKAIGQTNVDVQIFDSNGILQAKGLYKDGSRIDISCLEKGIYVVVANSRSLKLIKI